jgi:hypothetical protein
MLRLVTTFRKEAPRLYLQIFFLNLLRPVSISEHTRNGNIDAHACSCNITK